MTNKDIFFEERYKNLNQRQREAVDTIDGPVMVIAGPGTGKTEVLTMRIANILKKTDTPANGILCLTFTRSGQDAMKRRLLNYIGNSAREVTVSTFHSFLFSLVEKYSELLDYEKVPELIGDEESILLLNEIMDSGDYAYIKTRNSSGRIFSDIKSFGSLLVRESISLHAFKNLTLDEITFLEEDESSLSSRGPSKGQIKKEVLSKIETLKKSLEVARVLEEYKNLKFQKSLLDYDDILELGLRLTEFPDVVSDIRENYLYVHVDEHQDSSLAQNNFLKNVWQDVEKPNIFVVGDDRQIIYGFSGADINYFADFTNTFSGTKVITLIDNYRSSAEILHIADMLLQSTLADGKLKSFKGSFKNIALKEFNYERDEYIFAASYFKDLIDSGVNPNECALLVPKNKNVHSAENVFRLFGIDTFSSSARNVLSLKEVKDLILIFKLISDPTDATKILESLISPHSQVSPIESHTFIKSLKNKTDITLLDLINQKEGMGMLEKPTAISLWGQTITDFVNELSFEQISFAVSRVVNQLLIDNSKSAEIMMNNIEIARSIIHFAVSFEEKNKNKTLSDFAHYLERMEDVNLDINKISLSKDSAVSIMTLHRSKGLEYKHVIVAGLSQENLMSKKHGGFKLPQKIEHILEAKDTAAAKRELYVAITRAKEDCTITYHVNSASGTASSMAHILEDVGVDNFDFTTKEENEKLLLQKGHDIFLRYTKAQIKSKTDSLKEIINFVSGNYTSCVVSVSLLNNFYECPRKWYFRNFLKLPEVKSTSLALGSIVHAGIEEILKTKVLFNEKTVLSFVKEESVKQGLFESTKNQKDFNNIIKTASDIIISWQEHDYPGLKSKYESEKSVSITDKNFPNLKIYGKLDLVEYDKDIVYVTDFKTGSVKTKNDIEKEKDGRYSSLMRQLAMYGYLMHNSGSASTIFTKLIFLEDLADGKNRTYGVAINNEHIDILVKDIKDYEHSIINGDWVTASCSGDFFNKKEPCEYCNKFSKIFN